MKMTGRTTRQVTTPTPLVAGALLLTALFSLSSRTEGFSVTTRPQFSKLSHRRYDHFSNEQSPLYKRQTMVLNNAAEDAGASAPSAPAPILNGKRVLPYKVMKNGLKGYKVAAVYALINNKYKRGSEGWENVEFVGTTKDLDTALQEHVDELGDSQVAHIRALSFSFPQPSAMEEVAFTWRNSVKEAGGPVLNPADYLFDEDDDDDDDDDFDEWEPELAAGASATLSSPPASGGEVVSPFDPQVDDKSGEIPVTSEGVLPLTKENVDKVLDEVRPYLIQDGGNVAVEGIDEDKGEVFLRLEGACGSCASSTVTMEMGIERVLKENFDGFTRVVQVEDPDGAVTELTWEVVEAEFDRVYPAIMAMGGVSKLVGIDKNLGVVQLTYRGPNKIKQGLELALLDVPFVNRVEFAMDEEN